jgi:hypothetical protein
VNCWHDCRDFSELELHRRGVPLGARASRQQLGLGLPSREGADGNVGFLTSSSNSITKRPFANSL